MVGIYDSRKRILTPMFSLQRSHVKMVRKEGTLVFSLSAMPSDTNPGWSYDDQQRFIDL
jgi:hypothetical protein